MEHTVEDIRYNLAEIMDGIFNQTVTNDELDRVVEFFSTILEGLVMEEQGYSPKDSDHYIEWIEGWNSAVQESDRRISTIQNSLKGDDK